MLHFFRLTDLIEEIKVGKVEYKDEDWTGVSKEAKDLVCKLLEKDSALRFSPIQSLSHEWIMSVRVSSINS